MFVNEIKARAYILATTGVTAGRVIANFENRVEFELPYTGGHDALIAKIEETMPKHVAENTGVGETMRLFDLGYGRSFFLKLNDKGLTAGMQQVFKASENLLDAIHQVWQEVYMDANVRDNEEAIELVLDAGRLETLGSKEGKAANEELDALTEVYGQPKVDKELAKLVKLV